MPKKKNDETPEEQAERFKATVLAMIAAGELSPTDADDAFERAMKGVGQLRESWFEPEAGQENPEREL